MELKSNRTELRKLTTTRGRQPVTWPMSRKTRRKIEKLEQQTEGDKGVTRLKDLHIQGV